MSGGSFNYLFTRDVDDLWYGPGEEWDWMLDELDELCPEASKEMRQIKSSLTEFMNQHDKRWSRLQPLLKAIEYWRSGDFSQDKVFLEIERYKDG